eukprot:3237547-Amphidinium_carterae.1
MRVVQDVDTVITSAMNIQAEVGTILQDTSHVREASRKPGPCAQAAEIPSAPNPRKDNAHAKLCQYWGTKQAVNLGQHVGTHTYEKAGPGLHFSCDITEHTAAKCWRVDEGSLSAGVDYDCACGEAPLDSGASHVMLQGDSEASTSFW